MKEWLCGKCLKNIWEIINSEEMICKCCGNKVFINKLKRYNKN